MNLADAREKAEDWRRWDVVRPHGAVGDGPPLALPTGLGPKARSANQPEDLI